MTKDEFKAKLDGSFQRLLRAAYVSGYDDGYDQGCYEGSGAAFAKGTKSDVEIEGCFQEWLNDPTRHEVEI